MFIQTHGVQGMCETEKKKRKIGGEKRVNSIPGAMDNMQRDKYPCLHCHAVKMASLLGSLYLCEQLFSRMKYTKSSARSALTDEHLQAVLRIATYTRRKRSNVNRHIEHHHGSLIAAV